MNKKIPHETEKDFAINGGMSVAHTFCGFKSIGNGVDGL